MIDRKGRVWLSAAVRGPANPDFCKAGSDHLVRAWHQKLDEVERRVELLLKDDTGRFFTRPFPEEEGD